MYRDAALRSLEEMEKEAVRFDERAERRLKLVEAGVYDENFLKLEVTIWKNQAKQIREQVEILRKKIYE
jgi:aminoglycoside phosphotransferase